MDFFLLEQYPILKSNLSLTQDFLNLNPENQTHAFTDLFLGSLKPLHKNTLERATNIFDVDGKELLKKEVCRIVL